MALRLEKHNTFRGKLEIHFFLSIINSQNTWCFHSSFVIRTILGYADSLKTFNYTKCLICDLPNELICSGFGFSRTFFLRENGPYLNFAKVFPKKVLSAIVCFNYTRPHTERQLTLIWILREINFRSNWREIRIMS